MVQKGDADEVLQFFDNEKTVRDDEERDLENLFRMQKTWREHVIANKPFLHNLEPYNKMTPFKQYIKREYHVCNCNFYFVTN